MSDKLTLIARAFVKMIRNGEIPIPAEAEREKARKDLIARIEAAIGASVAEFPLIGPSQFPELGTT